MRNWIPFVSSDSDNEKAATESEVGSESETENETPPVSELLNQENVSETRDELKKVWQNDREQAYFFIYAICAGVGFVGLMYYYGGLIPWYVAVGYITVVLGGLSVLFDDALDEGPYSESENAIIQYLR